MSDYPWLIDECGVNWKNLEQAEDMIRAAADAGFNFAKFQLFDDAVIEKIPSDAVRAELAGKKLGRTEIRRLCAVGRENRIEVFFTAMYEDAFHLLERAQVPPFVKVRLADEHNIPLWQAHARDWHGTTLYSTGNPEAEYGAGRIPLFCIGKYPAAPDEYEPAFAHASERRIGISLHAPDPALLKRILLSQFLAVELHVRLPYVTDCIDYAVSFSFTEAKELIREVRHADAVLVGQPSDEPGVLRQPGDLDCEAPPTKRALAVRKKRRMLRRAIAGKERAADPGDGERAGDCG